jgi:hypothetical protein
MWLPEYQGWRIRKLSPTTLKTRNKSGSIEVAPNIVLQIADKTMRDPYFERSFSLGKMLLTETTRCPCAYLYDFSFPDRTVYGRFTEYSSVGRL